MQMIPNDAPWLAPVTAMVATGAAVGMSALTNDALLSGLLREGGEIETASALLHFLAAMLALAFWPRARGVLGLIAVCAFIMGARELDWHHAFTTHGLFSSKQYFRDTVPMAEKFLAGAIALSLLGLLGTSLVASMRDIRRLVADRAAAVTGLVTVAIIVPLLMLVDAAPRLERDAGLTPSAGHVGYLLSIEELGELALPVIVMLVILQVAQFFGRVPKTAGKPSGAIVLLVD